MLAMVVNDNAGCLNARVIPTFIASKLAPTEGGVARRSAVMAISTALARVQMSAARLPPP